MILPALFWLSLALIAYTYVLYPLLLLVIRMVSKGKQHAPSGRMPSVSIVISIFNEKDVIAEKIKNLLALDYPKDRIEYVIGSDGSTDGSNETILQTAMPRLKLRAFQQRRGKAAVLNDIVPLAKSEIVVLSDANTFYDASTLKKLVGHFEDPSVGAVCGELILRSDDKTAGGFGEGYYWRYENALKRLESDIKTTVGATGGIYAIRKSLFVPLPVDKPVMDDFITSLNVIRKGYSVKYEPEAVAYERPSNSMGGEFQRKVRIGAANFHGLSEFGTLLLPEYGFATFALWSRKMLRWLVPLLLIILAVTGTYCASESIPIRIFAYLGLLFLCSAAIGLILDRRGMKTGVFGLPYYFIAMNAALLVGFLKFISRRQPAAWKVVR